jgi:DNA-binding GntR family transcriptional regulator
VMCNILHIADSLKGPGGLCGVGAVCAICCMPIPAGGPAVDRSLLRDDVYRRLRDAIVDGTFQPGEQLKDVELAEWLGVSRTPVREALLRLGGSGLVVARPGRSTTVSVIDARAVADARDVIAAMHELAVRQVTGRLGDDDLARMRDANDRFAAAVAARDVAAALDADEQMHRVPVDALGNHALAAVLDQFEPLVRRAARLRFSADGHTSVDLHARLIDRIAAGDVRAAAPLAFDIWHTLPTERLSP